MPKIWKKLLFCVALTGLGSLGVASAAVTDQLESPASLDARNHEAAPPPPSILFGQLFRDVELGQVFKDQKTFCDLIPTQKPAQILAEYSAEKTSPSFSLSAFVAAHFRMQTGAPVVLPAAPGVPVQTYIAGLWNVLQEQTGDVDDIAPYSSLLRLPRPFVVPGGRFLEMYYWDSYFTMLGLEADGRHDIARNMVDDFAYEIDHYGHIPNGNRTYYLSRSQPPFFSKMVDLMAAREGEAAYVRYLPELEREYDYWMKGANALPPGRAYRNVVRLRNGVLLNRYWDARDVPRDESYREDIITAQTANRPAPELWRNLRATAESGWDFSSRWLGDGQHLATVETLNLLPVDLNSLMEHLERTIARGYALKGESRHARLFEARACERAAVIRSLMWDRRLHLFSDFRWTDGQLTHRVTAATLYPLFFHIADRQQGIEVARAVAGELLMPNGVATTTVFTSTQQWDQPNGWAPLQWIAVSGFNAYGEKPLAKAIAERWMHANLTVFYATGKLVEKYDLITASGGAGGEYATQIGFGWTNGVLRQLMTLYPRL